MTDTTTLSSSTPSSTPSPTPSPTPQKLPVKILPPPPVRGQYARYVLEHGHEVGVLSGVGFSGRARDYAGWYSGVRHRVARWAEQHGVRWALVLHPRRRRRVRVWTDAETGERVRVVIQDPPAAAG